MLNFAANLTMLFQEHDFLDRFDAAHKAGFNYVEYLFPYAYTPHELKGRLDQHQVKQVLFNLPPGNWDAGERGIACLPKRVNEFKHGVDQAITYAEVLEVPRLNCLSGLKPGDLEDNQAFDTFVSNLDYAATQLESAGIELVFEAINSKVDMPGFFADTLDISQRILSEVNHPNLGFQFDLYHMQIMHGALVPLLQAHWNSIKHIQFADTPGRHEPGTGTINFSEVFRYLEQANYSGFVSAEYIPKADTVASLGWLQTFN